MWMRKERDKSIFLCTRLGIIKVIYIKLTAIKQIDILIDRLLILTGYTYITIRARIRQVHEETPTHVSNRKKFSCFQKLLIIYWFIWICYVFLLPPAKMHNCSWCYYLVPPPSPKTTQISFTTAPNNAHPLYMFFCEKREMMRLCNWCFTHGSSKDYTV